MRHKAFKNVAGSGCLHTFGAEQIFHANRHTRKRLQPFGRTIPVSLLRRRNRVIRRFDDKRIERLRACHSGIERIRNFAR